MSVWQPIPVHNHSSLSRRLFLSGLFLFATPLARADVKLPAIFGSHMVLQQERKIPVWGTAGPGEAVTVTLGGQTTRATADAQGKWRVDLAPLANSTTPLTLTVAGKNNLAFDDVLVGDVWICSGQSNMEFDLSGDHSFGGAANAATAVPAAHDEQLRLFIVKRKASLQPESDVIGEWKVCTPESAGLFSAVGYFFGQELRRTLHRPIGLIGTYWGGMPAQAFTSLSGLQKVPPFTNYVEAYQKIADQPAGGAGGAARCHGRVPRETQGVERERGGQDLPGRGGQVENRVGRGQDQWRAGSTRAAGARFPAQIATFARRWPIDAHLSL